MWDPSPQDYNGLEDQRNEQNKANQQKITSQLPSIKAMHSGGTALKRKNMSVKKKSSMHNSSNANEVINMTSITIKGNEAPYASAQPNPQISDEYDEFTYKDLDNLKDLILPIKKKKDLRNKILEEKGNKGKVSKWSSNENVKWRRFKEDANDLLRHMQLWRSSVHEIEGRFGNGVRSYFSFVRFLFILNLYIFFLIFIFIVVPTIAFENLRSSGLNVTFTSNNQNPVPPECQYNPFDPNAVAPFSQYIIWWFTGQGFMENTLLFYGYYDNAATSLQVDDGFTFVYNIPLAYLLVAFFYFALSLVLLVRRAAGGLKESLVDDEDRFYSYCNKVFGGWDFCITDENAAKLKHSSLKYELQTDLEEEKIRERQENRTRNEKIILYLKRIGINCIVLLILIASLVSIFFAANYALRNTSAFDDDFILDLIVTYLTSIVITVANFIAPVLFGLLIQFEDYSPAFAIKLTLIRTVFLRLASVVFLYVVVYLQVDCTGNNIVETEFQPNCTYCVGVQCWETYLGQEMYKLTILDFFIVIGVTLFIEFPRKLIVEHCQCGLAKWWGFQEFSIPTNVLDIVYSQTIGWIGAFYSPLLPVIVVIKFFVFFYLKKLTLMYNCQPATRPYRASRSGTFFFIILIVGFVVAVFPVIVSVAIIKPSEDCGPFRGWITMFYAVTDSILTLSQSAQQFFWFIGSTGFALIIAVILALMLYYYVALSNAHKKMIHLLKDQLTLEGKDKQYLLSRVNLLSSRLVGSQQAAPIKRHTSSRERAHRNQAYVQDDESPLPGQATP